MNARLLRARRIFGWLVLIPFVSLTASCYSTISMMTASQVDPNTFAREVEDATDADCDLVVIMKDGTKHEFEKGTLTFNGKDFSSQTLSNGRITLPLNKVAHVKLTRLDAGNTALAVVVIVLGAGAIIGGIVGGVAASAAGKH